MMRNHPTTSINPGFLSQLHLYANRRIYPAEYDLLHFQYYRYRDEMSNSQHVPFGRKIKCKKCGYVLCLTSEVVTQRDSECILKKFLDSFWSGYSSQHSSAKTISKLSKDFVLISPCRWSDAMIIRSIAEDKCEAPLSCPQCVSEVGGWRRKGLLVCDDYVSVDLFGLLKANIRLP